jgi:anti-sigma regulatory factor (Ser/Thr protein kinase)
VVEIPEDWVRIGVVARTLGLSASRVRQLADEGAIAFRRTEGGHRLFNVAAVRDTQIIRQLPKTGTHRPEGAPTWSREIALADADEAHVWERARDALALPDTPATKIMQYAFTELLNNAIDHSGSPVAVATWWVNRSVWTFEISDQGDGVFPHLQAGLGLPDLFASIQELTKGRTTTAPDRHTGEGIFFASKAVDVFVLASAGLAWTVDNLRNDQAVGTSAIVTGTRVTCELDPATDRQLSTLFSQFTNEDLDFSRSRTVVHLFGLGVRFVSRSEAKRLLNGLDRFETVEVDFSRVQEVGQGFVDELVRVWPSQHQNTTISPINMNDAVDFMVRRGLRNVGSAEPAP